MNNYTKQDIIEMVEDEDVAFIRLQFTDIFGTMKNTAVTASQLSKVLAHNCTFDGSSVKGFSETEESDMRLYPDLNTFEIFPWRPQQGKVARLICDIHLPDGTPYESDPRYVLKKITKKAAQIGYTMDAGPECEFFLFHTDETTGQPTTLTYETGSCFDVGPLDLGENARRDMVLTLEDMGFEIEGSHHEMAPAQHEIDFHYDEALATADNIMTFKLVVRTIAKRHGLHATFMPKPKQQYAGSGMHMNLSLNKDGVNIFRNDDDENGISREAYYFIGGLMKHMRAITAITNPTVNSYKRLTPGAEAPTYMSWSAKARNPLIRIPSVRGEHTRIELRSPDPSSNPYLVLAVLLAAGLEGIEKKIQPPKCVDKNIQSMNETELTSLQIGKLPRSLREATEELEKDSFIREVLGEELTKKIIASQKQDYQDYCMQVTDWEIAHYLQQI